MRYTNKFNLPPEIVAALTKDRYVADEEDWVTDFSVTTLISPVQQVILRLRYPGCNTEDVSDRIWMLFGHIAHSLLEEHASENSIVEKRFYKTILGKTISGMTDHYKDGIISDYKTTKAWKIVKGNFSDWEAQLNCYATLVEDYGFEINKLRIIGIIRDWSKGEAYKKGYPECAMPIIPILKWSRPVREKFMEDRVSRLIENENVPDELLPPCSAEERWMNFKDWYVLKEGNKVGRCFETEAAARAFAKGIDCVISQRFTQPRRCLEYCNVSSVCHQWAKEKELYVKTEAVAAPVKRGFGKKVNT